MEIKSEPRRVLRNDAYYGTGLFTPNDKNTKSGIPGRGRKVQSTKLIESIFFERDVEPDPGFWAMKKVRVVPDRVIRLSINAAGELVYTSPDDENLDFEIQNGMLVGIEPEEDSEP